MPQRRAHAPRTNGHATSPARKRGGGSGGRAAPRRTATPRAAPARPASARAISDNALTVLRADHERVTELFARFEKLKSNGPQKAHLCARICDELEIHARVEEELFYPSARGLIHDDALIDQAEVEHDSARALIAELRAMKPGDDKYDATVAVLGEYVKHHVGEEQGKMFPRVRDANIDLVALGRAIKTRKRQLKGDTAGQGLLGLTAFPGMMIP